MIAQRVSDFFGTDDDYVRARPERPWRTDWVIAVVLSVISMSVVIFGIAFPAVVSTASMQILYFLGIYTAMAYARRRHTLMLSIIAVLFAMVVWLVVADSYARSVQPDDFQPTLWFYVGTAVMNLGFFGGAIWLGRQAWLQAKVNHELAESQRIVREQGERLAAQAVVAERLRIARGLHDSVAHHISLIGVQTGAARRAMATKPDVAAQAMQEVETMSRDAVAELQEGIQGKEGLICTGDQFMCDPERIAKARADFPAMAAVEMEGAAIAQVCHQFGVPFVVTRSISDIAGKESPDSFEAYLEVAARHSSVMVVAMLKRM